MSGKDLYRFAFSGNDVVAVEEFDDGRWEPEHIERDETYERDGGAVIKKEINRSGSVVEITRYEDSDGDGVFHEVSEQYVTQSATGAGVNGAAGRDLYRFTFTGNSVTAVEEFDDGRWEPDRIERDESYVREGNVVIKTETGRSGAGVEITRYEDADGDGVFTKLSEIWQSSQATSLSGNDVVLLTSGVDAQGGQGADRFVFNGKSSVKVLDFAIGEGDKLVIDTGTGLGSVADLARYLVDIRSVEKQAVQIDFGQLGQITLVGVSAADLSTSMLDIVS